MLTEVQKDRFANILSGKASPDNDSEWKAAIAFSDSAPDDEVIAIFNGVDYEAEIIEPEPVTADNTPQTLSEPDPEPTQPEVTIKSIKTKIKVYAVDSDDLSDDEQSARRSEIFDEIAKLPASDQDQIKGSGCKVFDISLSAFNSEVKSRKSRDKATTDDVVPECKNFTGDGKRIIWTTHADGIAKQQGRLADEVFDALCEANDAEPFLFDNESWLTVRDGTERKAIVSSDEFRTILADRFDWMRSVNTKEGITHRPVPEVPIAITKSVENHKNRHVRFPRLERVANRPVMLRDGTFAAKRGYISELNAYLLSDYDIELMPSVKAARHALLDPFQHFPFASDKDRACAFAYLFTLLMREWLGDSVPFFHFGSARQGTGKGLLCDALYRIAEGYPIKPNTYYRDEIALERSVSSSLIQGAPGILFDNLPDSLNVSNPFLEKLATAIVMPVRVLYQTMESYVTVTAVTAFTGNNLSFDGGLRRRVQTCRLEADMEFPERRVGLPNLRDFVDTNRVALLSAGLTIVKAWHHAGSPQKNINLGSYEDWSNIIAGVLDTAGIEGFDPVSREMSDRDIARREFIRAVWNEFGDDPWGVKETLWIASDGNDEKEGMGILADFLTGDSRKHPARLGYILRGFAGQVFDFQDNALSLRIERVDGVSPVKYQITSQGSDVDKVKF